MSLLLSLTISVIIISIALDHNPMGEFCEYSEKRILERDCQINWFHLLNLGFIWFLFLFILTSLILFTVRFILF